MVMIMAQQNTSALAHLASPFLLVGAGRMGSAMLEGWLKLGLPPQHVRVEDPSPSTDVVNILAAYGAQGATQPLQGKAGIVVLAVKPQMLDSVAPRLREVIGPDTLVISILAGKTLGGLDAAVPHARAIIRAMPNTPASIGRGITAMIANGQVAPAQRELASAIMKAVGQVVWLDNETQMDAVTAVSGSGPAYVFLLAEQLAKAGEAAGLPASLAAQLARQTVAGAGELLNQSELDPAQLRQNVTSPAGTTAAALAVLMGQNGLGDVLIQAVAAATQRSRELAR